MSPAPTTRPPLLRFLGDIATSVMVAVVVFGAIQWWQGPESGDGLTIGEAPPAFELRDGRTGEVIRSSGLLGRPVVLNFWATWCVPCRAEMPAFEKLSLAAGKQLHVVTITADDPLLARRFLDEGGYTLPCLMDATGSVSDRYGVDRLPRTVILASDGTVAWDVVGTVDMAALRDTLRTLGR